MTNNIKNNLTIKEINVITVGFILFAILEAIRYFGVSEGMFYAILFTSLLGLIFVKTRKAFNEAMLEIQYAENKEWVRNYLKTLFYLEAILSELRSTLEINGEDVFLQDFDLEDINFDITVRYCDWYNYTLVNNIVQSIRTKNTTV